MFVSVFFDYCERSSWRRNSNSVMPTFRCRVFRLHSVTEAPLGRNAAIRSPYRDPWTPACRWDWSRWSGATTGAGRWV